MRSSLERTIEKGLLLGIGSNLLTAESIRICSSKAYLIRHRIYEKEYLATPESPHRLWLGEVRIALSTLAAITLDWFSSKPLRATEDFMAPQSFLPFSGRTMSRQNSALCRRTFLASPSESTTKAKSWEIHAIWTSPAALSFGETAR